MSDGRPNPDQLLRAIQRQPKARLRIFLGMSAGVGKTFAMLKAAHQQRSEGVDLVIGAVETHGRRETAALVDGLEVIPRIGIDYRGTRIEEMNLDAILLRKPKIAIVDELAHTNVPGSRHEKRYQDVLELLDAGIDVYTALNVQHIESRKEAVEGITLITIRETVPDSLLERANQIELVDIAPIELLKRLSEGKVYLGEKAARAADGFFKEDRLTALREIALRLTAERVDQDLQSFVPDQKAQGPWQTNERLMVAISHSPYSERLIRATRRLAYNLEAPWITVHVDTGVALSVEDQAQLAKNLKLARELNAELITTSETDVPTALKRIARQKNVTQVLVGRPTRRWIRDALTGGTLLDRLVREIGEIDVHVVRQETHPRASRPKLELPRVHMASEPIQYVKTLLFIAVISGFSAIVNPLVGYRTIGFVFMLGVMLVGMVAPLGPVVFAAIASAITWNFFFIPPVMTFAIFAPEDITMCFSFMFAALILGYLTHRIRFHERMVREREERTNFLYEILQDIANSTEKSEFLTKIVRRVGEALNANCSVYLSNPEGNLEFDFSKAYSQSLEEKAQAVATWAFRSQKAAGWSTDTLADAGALCIPLRGPSATWGVFVFTPKTVRRLSSEQETLLTSIVRQLSLSLERYFFELRSSEAKNLQASEKLHQTLLNSISHEMRTPLSSIIGAVSLLEIESNLRNLPYASQIVAELGEAGDRLNRVIENLLDMSRLNSGVLGLNFEWHDIEDLVNVVLGKLKSKLEDRIVEVGFAANLPGMKIDFRLLEHALSNLLINAIHYSPRGSKLGISTRVNLDKLNIFIDDAGPGIPANDRAKVFEKFYRLPGTPAGGTGLGLSIVRGIVEAHAGTVAIASSPAGGARIILSLPILSPASPANEEVTDES